MLSIVSTPIGNLGDITVRAMQVLKHADAIVCEDTRVTGQLLHLLELPKKELLSFHGYTDPSKADGIIERLKNGENIVLVSDAGTPCISDPGAVLTARVAEAKLPMCVVPGASAFLAALSVSGLPINAFTYLGFLPLKKGRKTLLETFREEERTIVFYESPHRMLKTFRELAEILKDQPERRISICRELTKLHEDVVRTTVGTLSEVAKTLKVKGEFVIVLGGR